VSRIAARFAELKAAKRAGFVAFISAGDPDCETSLQILKGLPKAGADIIELGMPFTDPMAEGPAIQASYLRALKSGQTMARTFAMARAFREGDKSTPLVLMGYFNPIYSYGAERFAREARDVGVDGLIIVDLTPEEDHELRGPAVAAGLDLIRLAAPTSDEGRLKTIVAGASGFIYYISITGPTGTKQVNPADAAVAVKRVKAATSLPVAVGFGIKTEDDAGAIAKIADAAVVGSALVAEIGRFVDASGRISPGATEAVLSLVARLANATHQTRK
jgi:tryptophan synthase alpha chain